MPSFCGENIGEYLVIVIALTIITADTIEIINDCEEWTLAKQHHTKEQFDICFAP